MKPLFSAVGRQAIASLMADRSALLAFDFDGTLAPIVARPDDARIPLPVAARLERLSAQRAVAIVTGRCVSDVVSRLGFQPRFVIGNHGIEDPDDARELLANRWVMALDPLRRRLAARASDLAESGVMVEDKRFSLALHYRLAPSETHARALIDSVLDQVASGLAIGSGKCVVNVVPGGAPDKGDAVLALARRCRAARGLFVGDDNNDEPVFRKVPESWVTVRIDRDHVRSQARYYVDAPSQLPALLQMLIDADRAPPA